MNSYKMTAFTILISAIFSCNNKQPFVPDYEIATGTIIGIENCKKDPSLNAWLIHIPGPNPLSKTFGEEIVYNGIVYKNVVKSFSLPDSAKMPGKQYSFEFNLDGKSDAETCDAPDAVYFKLTKIKIRNVGRAPN